MRKGKIALGMPVAWYAVLLIVFQSGCAATSAKVVKQGSTETQVGKQAVVKQGARKTAGKTLGVSNKAKTITIADKKLGDLLIKFDDQTTGLKHAKKGEAVIINFRMEGSSRIATSIKPKLAKLPPGVIEITPAELAELISQNADLMLIDSRPAREYDMGHIETALSIPVEKLKGEGKTLLPQDNKDKLLIFYCGGPT